MELDDDHLRAIAFKMGVPRMWLEDAAQEMRLAIWQSQQRGLRTKPITRAFGAAIDFSRHYGPRSRAGVDRVVVSLNQPVNPTRPAAGGRLGGRYGGELGALVPAPGDDVEDVVVTKVLLEEALELLKYEGPKTQRAVKRHALGYTDEYGSQATLRRLFRRKLRKGFAA